MKKKHIGLTLPVDVVLEGMFAEQEATPSDALMLSAFLYRDTMLTN